jgi:hypothetical protein
VNLYSKKHVQQLQKHQQTARPMKQTQLKRPVRALSWRTATL